MIITIDDAWFGCICFLMGVLVMWIIGYILIFSNFNKMTDQYRGEPVVRHIIVCPNEMVVVFDSRGNQIPEFQGRLSEKLWRKLRKHITDKTVIEDWRK